MVSFTLPLSLDCGCSILKWELEEEIITTVHTGTVLIDKKMHIRGIYNGTLQLEMRQIIDDIKTLKRLN